jgi:nicotinate phosphoribosyltransferase
MKKRGHHLLGVRLDSGDMAALSTKVRHLLNEGGLPEVRVIVSSGFDEKKIAAVLTRGGTIDGFGVGTRMGVSADAPYLDIVYKLVRFSDRGVRKLGTSKVTRAGKKQAFRKRDEHGFYCEDIIGAREEVISDAEPLLQKVMERGKTLQPFPALDKIRDDFRNNCSKLDDIYNALSEPATYPVSLSKRLRDIQNQA